MIPTAELVWLCVTAFGLGLLSSSIFLVEPTLFLLRSRQREAWVGVATIAIGLVLSAVGLTVLVVNG